MFLKLAASIPLLLSIVLSACAGNPPHPTVSPVTVATRTPALPITARPARPTVIATPTATSQSPLSALPDPARRGYATLVLLEGSAALLDETAQQIQVGTLTGAQGLPILLALGVVLNPIGETLKSPPPDPVLQTAWDQAAAIYPVVLKTLQRWADQEIAAGDVSQELAPARTQLNQVVSGAEDVLSQRYGLDRTQLEEVRAATLSQLRATLAQTPTP